MNSFFKYNFPLIFSILLYEKGYTQIQQEIRGKVADKESKTVLMGANIRLQNSTIGTISDTNGNFKILVPVGRVSIDISYTGYEEVIIPALEVTAGKEIFLNIELQENVAAHHLQNVIIRTSINKQAPLNSMATVSARLISTEDVSRYASGFGDPARMVSSFAGVVGVGGEDNNIVIRANSSRGLQWRVDGLDIPSPNHFSNGQGDGGGAFSVISANILANSDFYTSAFPAEYGNAIAGIMDLNIRKGSATRGSYSFQLGVTGAEAAAEGPIKKLTGSSYLFNYRYANFQPLNKLKLLDLSENQKPPIFQDLACKINLPTKKHGNFTLFALAGMSSTGVRGIKDSLQWRINPGSKEDETEDHKMAVIGLKHSLNFSDKKTFLRSILAATYEYNSFNSDLILTKKDSAKYPGVNIGNGYILFENGKNSFSYPSLKFSSTLNHKFNAHHTIRTGIVMSWLGFDVADIRYNLENSVAQQKSIYDTLADKNGSSALAEAFAQWKYRITDKFEINTGFHASYFWLNNHAAAEPRLGLKWQLSDKSLISYGFGIHSRIEPVSTYFAIIRQQAGIGTTANKNLGFTKSMHNVIGYDLAINKFLHLKSEIYYQYLFNVPVKENSQSSESILNLQYGIPDTTYSNTGKGYNKGFELTVEKNYSNNYYFLVTASFYDSKYRAGDGKLYNTYFNGKYSTNWLAGKDFYTGRTKQDIFGVNIKILLRGGFRYTGLLLTSNGIQFTEPFSEQSPSFFSLDMGLRYRRNYSKYSWIISLDVQNILDHKNILYYRPQYFRTMIFLNPAEGLGIIPVLNFKVQF